MKHIITSLLMAIVLFACDIKDNEVSPEYNFVKVYNDADVSISYYPVSAIEASDGGIIVLSAITDTQNTNYPTIHVMKTDNSGAIVWETNMDASYVSPVPRLIKMGDEIRFVCMDDNSFHTKVMSIDNSNGAITEVGDANKPYPLAANYSTATNTLVVLSYDDIGTNTVISGYDQSMGVTFSQSSPTNKDFSYDIFQHLKKQRSPFPFFINSFENGGSTYYSVNAFSNYTLSLLFVNHSSGLISGRVNGYQEQGGIGASIVKDNGMFAVAESRFNVGDISFAPETTIDINGTQNVTQLDALGYPDLTSESTVKIIKDEFNGKELVVYAATTKSNQLAIFFFDASTNELVHTKYLGHTNPVEIASFFKAADGGLVIVGKTWVAGRYERIILYKVATDEIKF